MTSPSAIYIAGVGSSPLPSRNAPAQHVVRALVSATTKALLDAGVTYDDVAQGVTNLKSNEFGDASLPFKAFDPTGIVVDEVEDGLELESAFRSVRDRGAQSVLVIVTKKSTAVALLLVSSSFLWSHPYLKDSAIVVREASSSASRTPSQPPTDLESICRIVWTLRGWSRDVVAPDAFLFREARSNHVFELSRADSKAIPDYKEVEHRQDGKHRLGYNPAVETRDVSLEDFEAVRAQESNYSKVVEGLQFNHKGGDRAALAKL